jgi:hypothetical protein
MLEEHGLLKRIGVIVHPRASDGLPAAFFDNEGLVMGYAFGPAYEAAERFSELYAARCPGVDNMTADLRKIVFHLNYRHHRRPIPRGALGRKLLDEVLHSAWQYKHPVPHGRQSKKVDNRPPRKHGPKHLPPPESSQGDLDLLG